MTTTQTILKASELRIGNWVKVPSGYGKVCTIDPDNNNNFGGVISNDNDTVWERKGIYDTAIKPISLTPEILEKAGYKDLKNVFFIEGNIYWNNMKLPHIKYLHQLQNLYFALTGQELEINL